MRRKGRQNAAKRKGRQNDNKELMKGRQNDKKRKQTKSENIIEKEGRSKPKRIYKRKRKEQEKRKRKKRRKHKEMGVKYDEIEAVLPKIRLIHLSSIKRIIQTFRKNQRRSCKEFKIE